MNRRNFIGLLLGAPLLLLPGEKQDGEASAEIALPSDPRKNHVHMDITAVGPVTLYVPPGYRIHTLFVGKMFP